MLRFHVHLVHENIASLFFFFTEFIVAVFRIAQNKIRKKKLISLNPTPLHTHTHFNPGNTE